MLLCPSSYPFAFSNQCTWQHSDRHIWRHIVSVTLTIQRTYMAIQENFVTLFPRHWRSNEHIWQFGKTSSHSFRYTDDPTNIYGNSGKLRHILSATLTIQRTYMAIRENFVTFFPLHWRSNEHIWQFGKTSSHSFRDTDDPTNIYGKFGILQGTFVLRKNL